MQNESTLSIIVQNQNRITQAKHVCRFEKLAISGNGHFGLKNIFTNYMNTNGR